MPTEGCRGAGTIIIDIRNARVLIITRCWHVTISCQPDGRPPQPVRPWKSGRVHLAEGSNVESLRVGSENMENLVTF